MYYLITYKQGSYLENTVIDCSPAIWIARCIEEFDESDYMPIFINAFPISDIEYRILKDHI